MSLMHPSPPPFPKPTVRTRVAAEWNHVVDLSTMQLLQLAFPSLLLFYIDPLVPIVAYLLQCWATSWDWRDRWASLLATAKKCGILLAALGIYLVLDHQQIWLIPTITTRLQLLWSLHLPGMLSLSPLNGRDLLARSLLLLPATPLLAIYYEYIDPRTGKRLNRILTLSDMQPKAPAKPAPTPASQTAPSAPPAQSATTKQKTSTPPKTKKPRPSSATQQMTIDSFLTPDPQPPTTAEAPNTVAGNQTQPAKTRPPVKPKQLPDIDWDAVQE